MLPGCGCLYRYYKRRTDSSRYWNDEWEWELDNGICFGRQHGHSDHHSKYSEREPTNPNNRSAGRRVNDPSGGICFYVHSHSVCECAAVPDGVLGVPAAVVCMFFVVRRGKWGYCWWTRRRDDRDGQSANGDECRERV